MYFKHNNNATRAFDRNQPVDPKALLSLITKLCVFALHTIDKQLRLQRIKNTANLLSVLCHLNRHEYHAILMKTHQNLLAEAENVSLADGKNILLDFTNAIKTAMEIIETKGEKYSDAWKTALQTKLKETRKMLHKKANRLEKKLKKISEAPTARLFAQQKNIKGAPSKKLKISSQGVQEKSGLDIEQAKENVFE